MVARVPFRPLVLCYHAVSEGWDDPLSIAPATLERQLRAVLRAGFEPVSADGVLGNRRRTFHVTFDDAYTSVEDALPVLDRLGVRATVFACSAYAADGAPLLIPELRERTAGRPEVLATMPWPQLRELAAHGVEIGSHTISHAHLPRLSDAELARELRESRERLEDELGRPCRYLAYPFGEDDGRVHAAARDAGYSAAYTLSGPARPIDLHALPRVDVYRGDGNARFAAKISPLHRPLQTVLAKARG
jgi:peptidoglycan/xylan/chitin deacetylase (PgdA/CDA1 family)